MLYASKVALANQARINMLNMRYLELSLYTNSVRNLAVKCVLLGAIGWSGIVYTKKDLYQLAEIYFMHAYPICLYFVFGYSVVAVSSFNLIALMAPGLALRGPDGSVHLAVEGMMIEYRTATGYFGKAMVWVFVTYIVYAWSAGGYRPLYTEVSIMFVACLGLFVMVSQSRIDVKEFSSGDVAMGSFYQEDEALEPTADGAADISATDLKPHSFVPSASKSSLQRTIQAPMF